MVAGCLCAAEFESSIFAPPLLSTAPSECKADMRFRLTGRWVASLAEGSGYS